MPVPEAVGAALRGGRLTTRLRRWRPASAPGRVPGAAVLVLRTLGVALARSPLGELAAHALGAGALIVIVPRAERLCAHREVQHKASERVLRGALSAGCTS